MDSKTGFSPPNHQGTKKINLEMAVSHRDTEVLRNLLWLKQPLGLVVKDIAQ
jgi:hypothetical protein